MFNSPSKCQYSISTEHRRHLWCNQLKISDQSMNKHDLPFAKIILLREDIAEVLINDGVEMDVKRVDQYHDFLRSHLRCPFSLLVNNINSYSYSFLAQEKLAEMEEINATATVVYNRVAKLAAETLAMYPRNHEWNLKIFSDRRDALEWLILEQDKSKKSACLA